MSLNELVESAQVVIDANGTRKAVLLDFALWEEILELLEDLEDAAEIDRLRGEDDELLPASPIQDWVDDLYGSQKPKNVVETLIAERREEAYEA